MFLPTYSIAFPDMENFQVAHDGTNNTSVAINDLEPGSTYWFCVRPYNECFVGSTSEPSKPIVIQKSDLISNKILDGNNIVWRKGFNQKFIILSPDVGRGRFAVVRQIMCRETNTMIAAKCFNRLDKAVVEKEFRILTQLKHPNVATVLNLFETETEFIILFKWFVFPKLICIK